ncbi:multidrug efflux system CmeABC transcriptional regulator, TetR family [Campylobacter lari]|uniref:TetR/AcrR family transcriptional regulator n=1 Tax=Campylobacter TaxID=194 RepID=UPI00057C51B3|nr:MULTISPECIES: TetR/AcrR family transcriptional regulator [Campylobacter]AJD04054.1 multidrug efflux system CmeABC transcriptional regulator, TetR family [Campylobacter lari CCUG 22395]AJD05537.1 multidrug efflux system CmeABC transcriptional regulator, TetR family [Campylobacter lari RM16701]AJD07037.1 multidrug efflux system CmeABC transcriptional regulator, TetR family [Campylobacter lari RM16712]EAK9944836.1 multidrug efflux system CmeABC transcriptional regulator, TetR family [Campylobac
MKKKLSTKSQARLEKIKQIASESFLKNGYEATNLKDIIKQTGGSFSSVYEHFKSKEGLFEDILNDFAENHFLANLKKNMKITNELSLEEYLYQYSLAYLKIFNNKKTISIVRLLYSQIYNDKFDFSSWFKGNNRKEVENVLRKRFEMENEHLANNAEFLSVTFCAMLRGTFFMQSIFGNKVLMNKKEQEEHASKIVKLFISGVINFN